MERRSTVPSGIGLALEQQRDALNMGKNVDAERTTIPSGPGVHGRTTTDERMSARLVQGLENTGDKTPTVDIDDMQGYEPSKVNVAQDSVFRDFCTGHPPRRSFLNSASGSPPRFPMSRRSTLADKPELDTLLRTLTIQFKNEDFLPIDENTVRRLNQYTNGSKPLACTCRFERLLINSKTSKVRVGLFLKVLENIGMHCNHLAIVAPFHPMELGNAFECEVGNSEPGTDWEKIIDCLPNLEVLTFHHPCQQVTNVTRHSFYTLARALRNDTNIQTIVDLRLFVPPKVCFNFHKDHHSSPGSSPLCLVAADVVYADGPKDFGLLDNGSVFGKAEIVKSGSSGPSVHAACIM